jgi:hypothetical protein
VVKKRFWSFYVAPVHRAAFVGAESKTQISSDTYQDWVSLCNGWHTPKTPKVLLKSGGKKPLCRGVEDNYTAKVK